MDKTEKQLWDSEGTRIRQYRHQRVTEIQVGEADHDRPLKALLIPENVAESSH